MSTIHKLFFFNFDNPNFRSNSANVARFFYERHFVKMRAVPVSKSVQLKFYANICLYKLVTIDL